MKNTPIIKTAEDNKTILNLLWFKFIGILVRETDVNLLLVCDLRKNHYFRISSWSVFYQAYASGALPPGPGHMSFS
jgi:hypothetical protein